MSLFLKSLFGPCVNQRRDIAGGMRWGAVLPKSLNETSAAPLDLPAVPAVAVRGPGVSTPGHSRSSVLNSPCDLG